MSALMQPSSMGEPLPTQLAELAGLNWSDGSGNFSDVPLNDRPARGRQHKDGDPALPKILLVAEILVRGDEQVERSVFGSGQQITVAQVGPTSLVRRLD